MANVLNMSKLPDENDAEGLQAYLRNGLSVIHENPEIPLPMDAYMNLYTVVWRLITSEKLLYADAIYQDLANFLADYLQTVVKRLQSQEDGPLLDAYLSEWDRYVAGANRINHLLNLINRHWINRCIDEGKQGIYLIRTLHFVQWRSCVWDKISVAVIDSAQLVTEKDGSKAAKAYDILESFALLRIDYSVLNKDDTRTRIRKSLEAPFLPEIEAHERNLEDIAAARQSRGHHLDG